MYFESREQAGQALVNQVVEKYRYENCAVLAVNEGGVIVGEQLAAALHCVMMLLITEDIEVPGEGLNFGSVSQTGDFTYNSQFSSGEIYEYTSEFHGYLDEQKRQAFQRINRLLGEGGTVDINLLRDRVVLLVSDGLHGGASLDVVLDFLKPIRIERLVVLAPVADVAAVDKIHVQADELHILDVKENYLGTNHYYDSNDMPDRDTVIQKISDVITKWHWGVATNGRKV